MPKSTCTNGLQTLKRLDVRFCAQTLGCVFALIEMNDRFESAPVWRATPLPQEPSLAEFTAAGKAARRRSQHILWEGRLVQFDSVKRVAQINWGQGGDGQDVAEASNHSRGAGRLDKNLCASPRTLSAVRSGEFRGLSATAGERS